MSNFISVLNVKLYLSLECQTLSQYLMSNFISVLNVKLYLSIERQTLSQY